MRRAGVAAAPVIDAAPSGRHRASVRGARSGGRLGASTAASALGRRSAKVRRPTVRRVLALCRGRLRRRGAWCSSLEDLQRDPPPPAVRRALSRGRDPAAGRRTPAAGEIRQARPGGADHLRGVRLRAALALGTEPGVARAWCSRSSSPMRFRGRKPWRTAFNIAQYALAYARRLAGADRQLGRHRRPSRREHRRATTCRPLLAAGGRVLPGQRPAGGRRGGAPPAGSWKSVLLDAPGLPYHQHGSTAVPFALAGRGGRAQRRLPAAAARAALCRRTSRGSGRRSASGRRCTIR